MKKAVFLDRDGVINKERKDYVKSIEEFQILNNIPKSIKMLKEKGFLVIVITNQSAINRGLITIETLNEIHNYLQNFLKENNTSIDDFYFCPHRPDENCKCRKPNPGMLIKAAQEHNIDMNQSFMIGNSLTDIQAAQKSGCKGILLNQNQALLELVTDKIKVNFA
jgi:D-glycero-D-manno-heptose 1,7-bisphosphate phosphatase|tara:strand:- start:687 stop:1181 length:495 start_codon:yes stop_codon:yes gene_type:complete